VSLAFRTVILGRRLLPLAMLSDRDIATQLDEDKVGDLVEAISAAP
jgi:hypothetical protein